MLFKVPMNILKKKNKRDTMFTKLIKNTTASYFIAILCTLLWGTAFPFIKMGYISFAIEENDIGAKLIFAGLRFMIAGFMVYLTVWITDRKLPTLNKNDILPVTGLGLVQTAAQYIFTYIGIGFTSGTNTSIITACGAFFTVLAVPLFFRSDKLNIFKILGCIIGFAGVIAINRGGAVSADTMLGDVLILFSTVSAAGGNIISKKVALNRNPIKVTAFQLVIGGTVLLLSGFVCGGRLEFANIQSILILLWLAFVSAAAFSLWTALLKHHQASRISIFNLLVPVFGTFLSGVMLGEAVFRIETLVSLVLISAGIVLVNIKKEEKR